jgi:predicted nucleic acid-binding protein
VKGKNAHDARLVAAMQRHGLTRLLTFNKPDFMRFPGINVYSPAEVLAGGIP